MTAGRGITHSERFERARREGGHMDGIQAWIALPKEKEETDPGFSHHGASDLPGFEERGKSIRLIAGEAFGAKSPVPVYSPLFYLHCELSRDAVVDLGTEYPERAAYVASGALEAGGRRFETGEMLVFSPRRQATLRAVTPATVMLLGGEPVGERFIEWNFVSSSRERIEQAKADWRAGRIKLPDLDHDEFIPLPPDPARAAEPDVLSTTTSSSRISSPLGSRTRRRRQEIRASSHALDLHQVPPPPRADTCRWLGVREVHGQTSGRRRRDSAASRLPMFRGTPRELAALARQAFVMQAPAGSAIVRRGERVPGLVVAEGLASSP